jgi:hypothetical protein
MDEKPDEIMSHIESQRDQLGRNLNELESRVKGATDWRLQFDKNPMMMMGVAVGGGILLGSLVGGAARKRSSSTNRASWSSSSRNYGSNPGATSSGGSYTGASYGSGTPSYGSGVSNLSSAGSSSSSYSSPAVREQRKKANETLDHIKSALIGFATAKVKEFMSEALPGFNQHLDEAQRKYASSSQGSSSYDQPGSSRTSGSETTGSGQYGAPATTRTEQSANSPYVQQGAGQNTGLKV